MKNFTNTQQKFILATCGYALVAAAVIFLALRFANPAPPKKIVISTGDEEGGYPTYARLYRDIIKDDGVQLDIRPSSGARENLKLLEDPKSDVDVAFVQDGLAPTDHVANLVSLGSLYYEPLWVFYRGKTELKRFSQLVGKRIAIGEHGGGTPALSRRVLKLSGVTKENSEFVRANYADSAELLKNGKVDVAFFLASDESPLVKKMFAVPGVRLMSVDQADALTRQLPYLHHLVLPHGAIDLKENIPDKDVDLISSTATLVAREDFHPALTFLLLKAASEVHSEPGLFERKGEFPIDKDYDFILSDEAKHFYKNGTPFWQRFFPFWIASIIDRFILVFFPLLALLIPLIKLVPRVLDWRVRSRIYKRYGELKYLETQMKGEKDRENFARHLRELDSIEEKVNHLKIPLEFSEHLYVLREHIEFVRSRLTRTASRP